MDKTIWKRTLYSLPALLINFGGPYAGLSYELSSMLAIGFILLVWINVK